MVTAQYRHNAANDVELFGEQGLQEIVADLNNSLFAA